MNITLIYLVPALLAIMALALMRIRALAALKKSYQVLENLNSPEGELREQVQRIVPKDTALRSKLLSQEVLITTLTFESFNFLRAQPTLQHILLSLLCGVSLGIMIYEGRERRRKLREKNATDYFLPVVMERIVMAVESGLDIIPAIDAIVLLEERQKKILDPVTKILRDIKQYTDSNIGFADALKLATEGIDAPSVKHAMIHLGLAYREGGEIIHPLRELSDATQLHYQEAIEEEIAKLPVKATVPLLCTFAGLIILFLTSPLIQVMKIAGQAMPQ